ncbi:GspE/PulE family protein [Clostridium fermenticellae]|uniref:GspE/PulE family protein n=1 Tax=Clostridium fermenticellae TaxID=2068654 RepID=UPI001FAAAC19|nr:GspE/PulE family protein [Clostridium fermenticellae]
MNLIDKSKFIDLENIKIDIEVIRSIPEKIAVDNSIIAFKEEEGELYIAVSSELKQSVIEKLKFITNKRLKLFYADKFKIANLINTYYCKYSVQMALENTRSGRNSNVLKSEIKSVQYSENMNDVPIVKTVNYIINAAICKQASDIHIEPFESYVVVRFRIDGIMHEFIKIPRDIYSHLSTRIKIMSGINITEKRMPQDGKIQYMYNKDKYDFRVSTLPVFFGEKIVIRILHRSDKLNNLKLLGFKDNDINIIHSMVNRPCGLILITGPTGSGKTTTVYSILNSMNKNKINITSIEDPVEYMIENVNQVNVNLKLGFNFPKGLRSILRQDPDVIMVGEIRDEETAKIAIRAAITGHLVISTLHTNGALESISRLLDMGVKDYFIRDALIGVISQRLIRKICPYCKKEYSPLLTEREELKVNDGLKLYKGTGCLRCENTGYKDRSVVYEIVDFKGIKKNIGDKFEWCNFRNKFKSIDDYCKDLIKSGVTTYEEFLKLKF